MASHSCRSIVGVRLAVALALPLALPAAPGAAPADHDELRADVPARSGTSAPGQGVQRRILERARAHPAAPRGSHSLQSQNDRDDRHIAILETDGSLFDFVESGLFVTRTADILQRFYETHEDDYDGVVIFVAADFAGDVNPEAGFAFELNVANDIAGIGLPQFNEGNTLVPGLQRLRTVINMNDLGEYDEDPDARLAVFLDGTSGIGLLAQEFLHMVGAFVNAANVDILGRGGAHWSFFFNSHGSALEGNAWHDNGDGTFTSLLPATGFSQLDLYLLGLLGPQQFTDPMYAITSPMPDLLDLDGEASLPVAGVTVAGTRTPVTLQNITVLHGTRLPAVESSPKEWRLAFILVTPSLQAVSEVDMEKIDDFRTLWVDTFRQETNGVGSLQTELGTVPVTADFELDMFAGPPGTTVTFDNDSFGSIRAFTWDFGDGQGSSARHPSHTYTTAGRYSVQLDVTGATNAQQRLRPDLVRIGAVHRWFEDDFEDDLGWTADPQDDATSGAFLRTFPIGSWLRRSYGNDVISAIVQPDTDHTPDGFLCYVTGLAGTASDVGFADVDGGTTSLVSPRIDLSAAEDPILEWWAWYVNNAGASPGRDVFGVDVSDDDGQTWARVRTQRSTFDHWRRFQVRLLDFVSLTDAVRVRFQVSDLSFPSLVEGALDDVAIFDVDSETAVSLADFGASVAAEHVTLSWRIQATAGDRVVGIDVQRSGTAAGPFETLERLPATSRGWEDHRAPRDAGTLWYRLVLSTARGAVIGPALAVDVSVAAVDRLDRIAEQEDGSVAIRYSLARAGAVSVAVHDIRGRRLLHRRLGPQTAGNHAWVWDRRDARGARLPRGVYFVRLETAGHAMNGKLLLQR